MDSISPPPSQIRPAQTISKINLVGPWIVVGVAFVAALVIIVSASSTDFSYAPQDIVVPKVKKGAGIAEDIQLLENELNSVSLENLDVELDNIQMEINP